MSWSQVNLNTSQQTIENAEMDLQQAMISGNVEQLERLIHPELLFTIPGGITVTKAMDLDGYRSGQMKISSLAPSDQQINIAGNIAVVSVKMALRGTFNGETIDGDYLYLRVWLLSGEQWQVIGGSCSLL